MLYSRGMIKGSLFLLWMALPFGQADHHGYKAQEFSFFLWIALPTGANYCYDSKTYRISLYRQYDGIEHKVCTYFEPTENIVMLISILSSSETARANCYGDNYEEI